MRLAGIEPARLSARDFKSLVSTYFTTVANVVTIIYQIVFVVNEFVSSVTIVINTIHPFIQDRSGLGTLLEIHPACTPSCTLIF